jgi:hypothetical protein
LMLVYAADSDPAKSMRLTTDVSTLAAEDLHESVGLMLAPVRAFDSMMSRILIMYLHRM